MKKSILSLQLLALSLGLAVASLSQSAHAATTITFANPAIVTDSTVSSTAGNPNITVPSGTWAVGDVIRFGATSPFSTNTRYYVVSVSGTTLQVSTTPGGAAINAANTTTTSVAQQGVDWLTTSNWTGGTAPNRNSTIADFGSFTNGGGNVPVVVNGAVTIYGLTFAGNNNGDLTLVSGGTGTSLNALTFATNDASTPKISLTAASNAVIFLGRSGSGTMTLKISGNQGLIFNSYQGGAITGSGTSATSTAPGKQIRLESIDWSGFSGGIQVERGYIQLSTSGQLPNQTLTVGNAQTITNNLLAGLNMNSQSATVDALNGNSLGRIWGTGTLTVGNANGTGNYGGVIGVDFTGATSATNLTKAGSGTQTISGVMAGTGTVTVNTNGGTLVLSNSGNSYTGATSVNSGGTLQLGSASALGSTASTTILSGGTLDFGGQTITNVISVAGAGVGGNGALVNNSGTAVTLNSEIINGASFTVGGSGDITLQRVRSGGAVMTLTKIGAGTLTLGNSNTTTHMNLLAVDVESASTVNFNTVSGTNYLVADRGVKIAAGGTVKYTGNGNNMVGDNQEVIVSNGTFNMNGISDTVGHLTIGDATNNGTISGGSGSTLTVTGSYQAFGAGGSTLTGGIEAMSGSADVILAGSGTALNKTTGGTVILTQANTYSGTTTISSGTLQLGDGTSGHDGTIANSISIVDNANLTYNRFGSSSYAGSISGSGTVTKLGAGTQILSGSNTYSGGTTIKAGTISQTAASALGSGTITLGDGLTSASATLSGAAGSTITNTNAITIASGGSGIYTIKNTSNSDYNFSGPIALNNAATFQTTGDGAMFLSGAITGSSLITIDGGGTTTKYVGLNTSSAGTFTGNILVQNKGELKFGNGASNALSTATTLTLDATSSMDTGLLSQTFAGLNDVVTGAGGSTIINAQSGTTLTLGGSGAYSYSGVISGSGNLTKSGNGTQTLAGNNSYSGTTTISGGTLKINGLQSGAGAYEVQSGGTLGGSGTITTAGNAGITLDAGGKLSPGNSPGTLTADLGSGVFDISAGVSATNSQSLLFDLTTTAASDRVLLSNASSTFNIGTGMLEFDDFVFSTGAGFGLGLYTLFDSNNASGITGSLGSIVSGTIGSYAGTLSIITALDGSQDIVLDVTAVPEPATCGALAGLALSGLSLTNIIRRRSKRTTV